MLHKVVVGGGGGGGGLVWFICSFPHSHIQ
jgi:hypothetical protein